MKILKANTQDMGGGHTVDFRKKWPRKRPSLLAQESPGLCASPLIWRVRASAGKLTVVTKSNAQRYGMVLWDEIAGEVGRDYPDITTDKVLVDAMTARMVGRPRTLDVVVASNLHADILSDLAAALAGSLGIAPTANLNPPRFFPSMFEPIHGAAFDIAGKGIANPIGAFWTAVLMLEHLNEFEAGARLMSAIERVTAEGTAFTPDLGGTAATSELTDAICDIL